MSRRRRQLVDDDVPRLPRGRGLRLSMPELVRIVVTAGLLVVIIVMAKPCADAASNFVAGFDVPDAAPAAPAIPRPDELEFPGSSGVSVSLEGLTPEQQKQAIEDALARARAKAGAGAPGSGSAGPGGAGPRRAGPSRAGRGSAAP